MAGDGRKAFCRDRRQRKMRRVQQHLPSHTSQTASVSSSTTQPPSSLSVARAGASVENSIELSSSDSNSSDQSLYDDMGSSPPLKSHESDNNDSSGDELLNYFEKEKEERARAKSEYLAKLQEFNHSLDEFPQLQVLMKNRLNKNSSDRDSASFGREMIMSCVNGVILHRDEFLAKARQIDTLSEGDLLDRINSLLPMSICKKFNKVAAAGVLVDFWFLYCELEITSPRYSRESKLANRDFVGMLTRIEQITKEEIDESAVRDKTLKSVVIVRKEKDRLYKQGGGYLSSNKKLHKCPKCTHGFVDEPPSNKNAKKKNTEETTNWKRQCLKLDDFEKGISDAFPTDKHGRQLLKIPAPKLVPLLGHCHCVQLHASYTNSMNKCPVDCVDPETKIQHPHGECPICKCTCSFVYELKKHDTIVAAVEFEKKEKKAITPTNRAAATNYLVQVAKAASIVQAEALSMLNQHRAEGLVHASTDDIARQAANLGHHAHATFIANNPPSLQASQHLNRQIRVARHEDGAVFTNHRGDPSKTMNMRSYSKSTAAHQRARNTGLHPMPNSNDCMSSFASADSTLSTSSSTPHPPIIAIQAQQPPTPKQHRNGRKRVKKHIYSALSAEEPPTPLTTEAMAVVLDAMAQEQKSAVVARIDDAEEDGMSQGMSQGIMTQCVMMQKALLKRDRDCS